MAESQWIPQLSSQPNTGNSKSIIDLLEQNKIEQTPDNSGWSGMSDASKQNSIQAGLQAGQASGGLGGMLTAGGANAALMGAGPVGWGVMAGGLLLSAHEKKKQEEAAREQGRIQAEMLKRDNLMKLALSSANQDFGLV